MKQKSHQLVRQAVLFGLAFLLFVSNCCRQSTDPGDAEALAVIGVIADIHYFDPDLGNSGAAFEADILRDRKMIAESGALLESAVAGLTAAGIDILLVPGDLTKDGERTSHEKLAAIFAGLEEEGIDVYVVPGNHDVANPNAMSYVGDEAVPTESVTPAQFAQIYRECGYDDALERDPSSLSYLTEIAEDVWLFAIDACRYAENTDGSVTGGRFLPATWSWIEEKLGQAREQGKCVFGMMHHGIMEHFIGQTQFFADYVVEDFIVRSTALADGGMRVMFTGHFHSQDIVKLTRSDGFLFDIETGSPVTYPCPYRIVELMDDGTMRVSSHRIESIDYDTGGLPLAEYARLALVEGIESLVTGILVEDYGVSEADAAAAVPLMVEAIISHYAGDESPTAETLAAIENLKTDSNAFNQLLGHALEFIWMDLEPGDNDIVIDLETGAVWE